MAMTSETAGERMAWATDAAHGYVVAKSIEHAIELLVADGEWGTGAQERRDIANGAWLVIDGCRVRGEV